MASSSVPPDPQAASQLPAQPPEQPSALDLPKVIRFESLLRCGDEVWIEFAGQLYRLRRTKQNKLILTK